MLPLHCFTTLRNVLFCFKKERNNNYINSQSNIKFLQENQVLYYFLMQSEKPKEASQEPNKPIPAIETGLLPQ